MNEEEIPATKEELEELKETLENVNKTIKVKIFDIGKYWMYFVLAIALLLIGGGVVFADNFSYLIIMVYVGGLLFLPVGMVLGWIMTSPVMRAKVKRRLTGKNYGIVNIVSKGKRITSRIANLDNDLLFIGENLWVIYKQKVYTVDNDNVVAPINPEHVNVISGDVPTIFLSLDTMIPLSFSEEKTSVIPQQLAASILAYIENQVRKGTLWKNAKDIALIVIAIVAAAIAAYMAFKNNEILTQIQQEMEKGGHVISSMILR